MARQVVGVLTAFLLNCYGASATEAVGFFALTSYRATPSAGSSSYGSRASSSGTALARFPAITVSGSLAVSRCWASGQKRPDTQTYPRCCDSSLVSAFSGRTLDLRYRDEVNLFAVRLREVDYSLSERFGCRFVVVLDPFHDSAFWQAFY